MPTAWSSEDGANLSETTNALASRMVAPTAANVQRLQRNCRHVLLRLRAVDNHPSELLIEIGSNFFAGDWAPRRSKTGEACFHGNRHSNKSHCASTVFEAGRCDSGCNPFLQADRWRRELTWPRTDQLPKVSHQDVVRLCKSRFLLLQDRVLGKGLHTVKFNTLVRGDALTKDDE